MQWDRSNTIGLAKVSCSYCHGYGLRLARRGSDVPCPCVFRAIFRACYHRFQECIMKGPHTSPVTLEFCRGAEGRRTYSRKREEFMADFCLVSRRVLEEHEHRIFRFYFLLGGDWKLCCRQLHMQRGSFFHAVYRVEEKLGRTYAELRPYALFPLDEYFSGMVRKEPVAALRPAHSRLPLKPPVALPLSA